MIYIVKIDLNCDYFIALGIQLNRTDERIKKNSVNNR